MLCTYFSLILCNEEGRLFCLSIYSHLIEDGYEMVDFDWNSMFLQCDEENPIFCQKVARILKAKGEIVFDRNMCYLCKEVLNEFEEEEE